MRANLPPEVIAAIPLPTWRALFAAVGAPPGLSASPKSHHAIAAAFRKSDLEDSLARALHVIAAFETEDARVDIHHAAAALGYAELPGDATSPADLVARLLARAAAHAPTAELLSAAQTLRHRAFPPRPRHVFAGRTGVDPEVGEPTQYVDALTREVTAWARSRSFGAVTAIVPSAVAGVLSYEIVHEGRRESLVLGEGTTVARRLRSHLVSYAPRARRLAVVTDCMEAVLPLARMLGAVLFEDATHFTTEPAVDLFIVQQRGAAALDVKARAGDAEHEAVGGTWHSGKDHSVTPRGRNFFGALRRYKIRIEGGRLDYLTVRTTLARPGSGPPQCDTLIRPPHLLSVSEPELVPLMDAVFDEAHIANPAPRVRDFFALQPWIGLAQGWRAAEGDEGFRALVEQGLLVAVRKNRDVAPPGQPFGDRTATAHPFGPSRFLAVSADPIVPPFVVEEGALVVYVLSFERLAARVAEELGLTDPATGLDDDGVLRCGRRALGPTHFVLSLLTRPVREATEQRLRDEAEHGHAILVLPEGRGGKHVLHRIAMPPLAGPFRPMLGAIVRALRLESRVATTLYAPLDARVVVHRATGRGWVDGVLCPMSEAVVRLLEYLVEQKGHPVHTKDIAEHVARGHQHEDTTRRAIVGFFAAVEKGYEAAGREPPKDLHDFVSQPKRGLYELAVQAFVE